MIKPFWSTLMMMAPIIVPKMLPSPPSRGVPPITTAATARSRSVLPAKGKVVRKCA
jgi:hypothetical protein